MSTHRTDTQSHSIHHRHVRAQDEAADLVLPGERAEEPSDGGDGEHELTHVTDLYHPTLYINRELSWLAFNQRVLAEALDAGVPLLERIKFIAITCSNLDEFFMIRVAGLRQQLDLGVPDLPPDGMAPEDVLDRIQETVGAMYDTMSRTWNGELVTLLEESGIWVHGYDDLTDEAREWCEEYFLEDVFPVLTPLAIDPGHPFPHLLNRSLNLLLVIHDDVMDEDRVAVVQVPPVLARLVPIPTYKKGRHFALLGEIIAANADGLFPGLQVREWYRFRVTRNADLEIADDEASDLLKTMQEQVRRRRWGAVVRVELDRRTPKHLRKLLMQAMHLQPRDIYLVDAPLNLADLMELTRIDRKSLKDKAFLPRITARLRSGQNIYDAIRAGDILLHHPYDSFSSVVEFIESAADDPNVLAIKQTLYRVNGDSAIIAALARAAENGKQVTAFVELKARFDEENNIIWARALEQAGVHVVYGILGLKTHCKLSLVVRREKKSLRTYVHVGTGNYNETTARIYTDFGLMTSRAGIAYEASALFNYLTGYSHQSEWDAITIAPISMRQRLLGLIQREVERHTADRPGRIVAKLNALVDAQIIRALYRASQAGVVIDLHVRGICCLRPGIPGLSETIRVRSVIGRFLEHSRVFVFGAGDDCEIFISSADWMPRNLNRRVELMLRIDDGASRRRILDEILPVIDADTRRAWELMPDGGYRRIEVPTGTTRVSSQETFMRMAELAARDEDE